MRRTNSKWLNGCVALLAVLMSQGMEPASRSYGQTSELFASPVASASVSSATPTAATAPTAPSTAGLNSGVFAPPSITASGDVLPQTNMAFPQAEVAAAQAKAVAAFKPGTVYEVGKNSTIRRLTQAASPVRTASPVRRADYLPGYSTENAYRQAGALWTQGGPKVAQVASTAPVTATAPVTVQPAVATPVSATPTANPIQAYAVTKTGVEPSGIQMAGCSGAPVGGIDLSNLDLNPDGCGLQYAPAPSCGGGGCGSCGVGAASRGSCCGGQGVGCGGGCCGGGQMQCESAACKNRECSGLCGCDCCRPRFWARADALLWYMNGYATPGLATRSPAGTPQNIAGVLGNGSTQLLDGNRDFGDGLRVGGRLRTGYWFDPCRKFGIQGDFFALGNGGESARFNGTGDDSFARPFFNTNPDVNAQDSQIFSRPGLAQGSLDINTSSSVISAGPAFRWNLCCCQGNDGCCNPKSRRVDFLLGYRFFRVEEEFATREILRPTDGLFVDGTRYELNDRITTTNEFHGVELGLNHLHQRGPWMWDVAALCAVGEVQRTVALDGSTRISVPGFQDNTLPGGFFVGPNDIGRITDRDYAVIPQVRANLSYCIGCNWRLGVGYDFMYLSSAFRPDAYLNTAFDGSRLARQPTIGVVGDPVVTRKSDLFLHGANVNLTYNF